MRCQAGPMQLSMSQAKNSISLVCQVPLRSRSKGEVFLRKMVIDIEIVFMRGQSVEKVRF